MRWLRRRWYIAPYGENRYRVERGYPACPRSEVLGCYKNPGPPPNIAYQWVDGEYSVYATSFTTVEEAVAALVTATWQQAARRRTQHRINLHLATPVIRIPPV